MQGYKKGANLSDVYKMKSLYESKTPEEISREMRIELDVVEAHLKIEKEPLVRRRRARAQKGGQVESNVSE